MGGLNTKPTLLSSTFAALCLISLITCIFLSSGMSNTLFPSTSNADEWNEQPLGAMENISSSNESDELRLRLKAATDEKLILWYHLPSWYRPPKSVPSGSCGNCTITTNKLLINDSRTGAVIFHFSKINSESMPDPKTRNPDQLHIFWQSEPPTHLINRPHLIDSPYQFNATMSYRRYADFYVNGHVGNMKIVQDMNISLENIRMMKTNTAISIVSNCHSNLGAENRIKIIRRMQDLGLPIKGFGGCFKDKSLSRKQNIVKTIRHYKFFMSFENSYHCRDYITEKVLRNAFMSLSVPVVWGATKEDYSTYLPEGSYIFAEDFDTIDSLVSYLKYLDNNDTAYLEYFRWHKKPLPPISIPIPSMICQICRATHGINYDDRLRSDYDPQRPRFPTFTDGIVKRTAPLIKTFIRDQENNECIDNDPTKCVLCKKWKL